MKVLTILGARPQFIKASAISRVFSTDYSGKIEEKIVHTGQHYDDGMSDIFFREMGIPKPAYYLGVGSGNHGEQTAKMLSGIEEILMKEHPVAVIVYGDTNSTLAGALAAAKMDIPVVHIEAGLRSFNKKMPEEINRIMTDHVSALLFTPTHAGIKNLINEGFKKETTAPYSADNPGIFHCGDVMYDNTLYFTQRAKGLGKLSEKFLGKSSSYVLATLHRNTNTDIKERFENIWKAFSDIGKKSGWPVIVPLHPRTKKMLEANENLSRSVKNDPNICIIPPVSFLEMFNLEMHSEMILTDSGGVQKEAYFLKKPCIVLRAETEWVELPETGTCMLGDADPEKIIRQFMELKNKGELKFPQIFGDGKASEFICETISKLAK